MKKMVFICCVTFFSSCITTKYNQRYFQFNYEVEINPTNGKKMEIWIPIPQSNEVQTISNLEYDLDGLSFELKNENKHGNRYIYIYAKEGTKKTKNIKISCNVLRQEHSNIKYDDRLQKHGSFFQKNVKITISKLILVRNMPLVIYF